MKHIIGTQRSLNYLKIVNVAVTAKSTPEKIAGLTVASATNFTALFELLLGVGVT